MKVLVVYSSYHGFTQSCVKKLSAQLKEEVDLYNLKEKSPKTLEEYKTIIIGGPIYAGKLPTNLRKFLKKFNSEIIKKDIGLFISSGDTEKKYIEMNFSKEIIDKAVIKEHFGSGLYTDRLSFIEKFVLKLIKKYANYENFNTEAIKRFSDKINGLN